MRPRSMLAAPIAATLLLLPVATAWADETYTVEPGDTLSIIAARYDMSWPTIFEANRDIVADPHLIFPGQVLVIEEGPPFVEAAPATTSTSSGTVRPATGRVTSSYGYRVHPITGVYKLHTGTDFACGDGRAYAAQSGRVTAVTYDGANGNMVTLDHGGGTETRYAHLERATVSVGDQVTAGDVVGRIGATGYATGPHLHFEVIRNGSFVDPMAWLN